MDEEQLRAFATQLEADPDAIVERWRGRPDLIMDDIFRIRDIDSGELRDLKLFDVQRKVIHAYFYGDAGTLNMYKGRRIGYSFVVVACFLLEALFYPESFYPLVSRSWSQAKNRISDIQDLIDSAKVEIPTEKENADYIELWNGSAFQAYSADADTSRGDDSARAVLMDEMAFMENEKEALRAFGAFLALGENRKMVEVSTPNTKNDLFMQDHRRGSREGSNGVITIKQPTFANADEINPEISLYDQDVVPVRPDLNIDRVETDRMADPEGFAQEYLCRPISDEYSFFPEQGIARAIERGKADEYELGLDASKPHGFRRVMGVDIGINRDDTVLSVMDHNGGVRKQRALIVANKEVLREAGVRNPDRANANHIAQLVSYVHGRMDVDLVVMDKGGAGETFERIIERKLGRKVVGFDFSDKDGVNQMMGDTNICLRNDDMTLVPKDRIFDELNAIVKEKRDEYVKPKFSGKDHSESGKDDAAMATVLSAFPPNNTQAPATRPSTKERSVDDVESAKKPAVKEDEPVIPGQGAAKVQRSRRSRNNRFRGRNSRL